MTDEHFSPLPSAPPPPTEADYEAIAAAVMGTVRGRWFLAEFAKRNRNADSALIVERIERIEKLLHAPPAMPPAERVRIDLVEMAKAIARTRSEIAAIKLDGDTKGTLSEASEELGSIVRTTERATSDILAAAEQVQESAWMLRERGADGAICDALDRRANDIYSACSFQDLTGQRTRKVVDVLQFLEDRIRAMIEIWGGAVPDEDGAPAAVAAPHVGEDRTVPHLAQQDIDRMMPPARPAARRDEARQKAHDAAAAAAADSRGTDDWTHLGAAGEPVMTPSMAVIGATALAFDLTPVETVRQPELSPEVELQAEPAAEAEAQGEGEAEAQGEGEAEAQGEGEAEAQGESEAEPRAEAVPEAQAEAKAEPETGPPSGPAMDVDAALEAAPHSSPPQPIPEPTLEIESDAPSEPRTDPAAVLKRILAIIRAPSEPAAGWVAAQEASAPLVAAGGPGGPVAAPVAEPAATAAVSILAPAMAEIVAADGSGPHVVAVDGVAVEHVPPGVGAVLPSEPAELRAAHVGLIDEAADDILMPLPGPLTFDHAVDAMLNAPGRIDVAATHATAGVAPPVEARTADEPPAVTADPAAVAGSQSPLIIEAPEFTVSPPAPVLPAELAPEPIPLAETVAAPLAGPAEPEPPALAAEMRSAPIVDAPAAPASGRPAEPAVEAVAAALGPLVMPAPPPPPPVPPPTARPAEPARPAPRHPALAAIAALSDDEKIALFS